MQLQCWLLLFCKQWMQHMSCGQLLQRECPHSVWGQQHHSVRGEHQCLCLLLPSWLLLLYHKVHWVSIQQQLVLAGSGVSLSCLFLRQCQQEQLHLQCWVLFLPGHVPAVHTGLLLSQCLVTAALCAGHLLPTWQLCPQSMHCWYVLPKPDWCRLTMLCGLLLPQCHCTGSVSSGWNTLYQQRVDCSTIVSYWLLLQIWFYDFVCSWNPQQHIRCQCVFPLPCGLLLCSRKHSSCTLSCWQLLFSFFQDTLCTWNIQQHSWGQRVLCLHSWLLLCGRKHSSCTLSSRILLPQLCLSHTVCNGFILCGWTNCTHSVCWGKLLFCRWCQ